MRQVELRRAITPQATVPRFSLVPQAARRDPTLVELDRFVRLSTVLDDPMSVLEGVGDGTIQRDEVELLRQAYPATYDAIVTSVQQRLAMLDREPSYRHRLALATLLGTPTDPTLDPAFMVSVQSGYMRQPQGGGRQMTRPQRPMRADARPAATEMQELSDDLS